MAGGMFPVSLPRIYDFGHTMTLYGGRIPPDSSTLPPKFGVVKVGSSAASSSCVAPQAILSRPAVAVIVSVSLVWTWVRLLEQSERHAMFSS